MQQMQCPNCKSHATYRSGVLGCWVGFGSWFGWLIALLGMDMLSNACESAFINVQPLDLHFVARGVLFFIVGLSPYLFGLRAGRIWACTSCTYRWRIDTRG